MGLSEKVEQAKESFLVLCQQYNRMGEQRAAEFAAISNRDAEGYEAAATALNEQYKEMGYQLAALGKTLDRMGGAPVCVTSEKVKV